MQYIKLLLGQDLTQEGGLNESLVQSRSLQAPFARTFPTELDPKSTVNAGSPPSVRSIARSSFLRGKKPARGEKVCFGRSCWRSRVSASSCFASESNLRDSARERRVSAGWDD